MAELVPPGYDGLRDCPYPLFERIRMALVFLSWEELPREEQPPRRIWLDGPALTSHFKRVERDRERKLRGDGGQPESEMEVNSLARDMIVG